MSWDEGRRKMHSSGFRQQMSLKVLIIPVFCICAHLANVASSAATGVVTPLPHFSDQKIVIAVPKQQVDEHGGVFTRTMAALGSRIKKTIGDAHKTLFLHDPVKRVGQAGKKPPIKPWINEQRSLDSPQKFRPHQPDITAEMRGGKLTLPVVELGDDRMSELARTQPKPTPMANKINPYTNGVAASFPPGIDPYDGFIKYAAENLDTPMGNIVDYHSLEHYYGPQHPLSPYQKGKEGPSASAYADSFSYIGNNDVETSNSPPPPPPPPGPPGPGHGFRSHHPGGPPGNPHYSMNSQEHGVDMFHAPSPGEPRKPGPGPGPESPEMDDEYGPRPPPSHPPHPSPFGNKPSRGPPGPGFKGHAPPFNELSETDGGEENVPPPDMSVFEEGPPPELLNPKPVASPPSSEGANGPFSSPQIQNDQSQGGLDGGDDAIWGILDLAYMLEKGQLPGGEKGKDAASTSGSPADKNRLVTPLLNRPATPGMGSAEGGPGPFSATANKFDYDDSDDPPGLDESPDGKRPPQFGQGPFENNDSQESNDDYADDTY